MFFNEVIVKMEILKSAKTVVIGNREHKLYFFDEIDSTNNFAKKLIEEEKYDEAIIVARTQTAGRGRQGKSFYSPSDSGIYMTVVLNPNSKISTVVTLTAKIACIVAKSIFEIYGIQVGIKWVNDLYLNNRKVCGILCEADNDYKNMLLKHVFVGIGINMTTIDFPEDIKNSAGSLMINQDSFGNSVENNPEGDFYNTYRFRNLVECIVKNIYNGYQDSFDNFLSYYRKYSIILNESIYFVENGEKTNAKVMDIDSDGGLVVRCENGKEKTLRSGEITVRII